MSGPDYTVRAVAVAEPDRGPWEPDVDDRADRIEPAVDALLDGTLPETSPGDRVTLVPDAHYPFHPSSGFVTDPAVVAAVAAVVERRSGAAVAVAGASDDLVSVDRTAASLGYRSALDRVDATLVDLSGEPSTPVPGPAGGSEPTRDGPTPSVPERLLETAVIVVPTLRPTVAGPVAGGMRTLASLTDGAVEPPVAAVASTRAVDPVATVLDATTAYAGSPYAANALFAGPTAAVDAVAGSVLDRSVEDDEAVRRGLGSDEPTVAVEPVDGATDVDLDAVRAALPDGEVPPGDSMHPAVTTAYRLYAAVSGDAVPPHLEGDRP